MNRFLARTGLVIVGLLAAVGVGQAMTIQKVVSPGGIEAWLVEDYAVPVIAMNFAFGGGAAQDPAGKPGVANMLSGLLDEGAGDLDSRAFQAALDDRSISLSFDGGRDSFYGSIKTLSENRDEAFRLLALSLHAPRLDKEPVERVRSQIETNIRESANDPDTAAMLALCDITFPGHPYGLSIDGTVDSVAAITVADLNAYRARIFARDHLRVAVVGAISAADTAAMLDRVFGPLPAKAALLPVADIVPAAGHREVDQPNPQAVIRFSGPGIAKDDPDMMAAFVVNQIIGGGDSSSRLYAEVREKRGLAYSIGTQIVPLDHTGAVAGGTATRADRVDETLAVIKAELARFAAEGPTAEELTRSKNYLIGSYALRFDSSTKIARQLLGIQLDGHGIDYVEKRNGLVAAVTLDDAKRVARRLYGNATLAVVVVGPKKAEALPKS